MFMLRREKGVENATFRARITVVSHRFTPDRGKKATDSPRAPRTSPSHTRLRRGARALLFICIVYQNRQLSIRVAYPQRHRTIPVTAVEWPAGSEPRHRAGEVCQQSTRCELEGARKHNRSLAG